MSTTTTNTIVGISCDHCVDSVTDETSGIPGVAGIRVDLTGDAMVLTSNQPVSDQVVKTAVADAGYQVA